jgi:hypothetical protein
MQLEIKTKSGRFYKRVSWTGGDTPPTTFPRISNDFKNIRSFFFREQINGFKNYWGDMPNRDTLNIFWNRAHLDAWRTYSEQFGKTDNNISSQWK